MIFDLAILIRKRDFRSICLIDNGFVKNLSTEFMCDIIATLRRVEC
ncbi:hypothetical protein VEE44_28820 [Escherichia coli]|nr:hypothetical protein VEE44_28820 [Escherichia coli]